eukprot:TRINITY_DN19131_c0_g1_i1.p1 TRINITY_DN19131_c0_g1~~TRINITY_DN19131_c0_g1_i1.p1  ORF type:complete len:115 (-),score=16.18 TRINITY_DN19131_c0_g1_i1:111-455(-)
MHAKCAQRNITVGTFLIITCNESTTTITGKSENGKIGDESTSVLCQLCRVSFKRPIFLKKHKNNVHSGEMGLFYKEIEELNLIHGCRICDEKFASQNTLYHHMKRSMTLLQENH